MSKTVSKIKKSDEKGKGEFFVWTDGEVELLLNVVNEYKVKKAMEIWWLMSPLRKLW